MSVKEEGTMSDEVRRREPMSGQRMKIVVPERMLGAANRQANSGHLNGAITQKDIEDIVVAALLWQRDNAPVPTSAQVCELMAPFAQIQYPSHFIYFAEQWPRCMYAAPEPEVPMVEEISDKERADCNFACLNYIVNLVQAGDFEGAKHYADYVKAMERLAHQQRQST